MINIKVKPAPLHRWTGGKTRLIEVLLGFLPENFSRYYEPFVGAGSLFWELHQHTKCYISDAIPDLMSVYQVVREQPQELIDDLKKHVHQKEYYYKLRAVDRSEGFDSWTRVQRASRFLYLQATNYNGLYRVNLDGRCNTPYGDVKDPRICREELIWACHEALQGVDIGCKSYGEVLPEAGDFAYLDPPYYKPKASSIYTPKLFGAEEHLKLKEYCDRLHQRGVKFMLSNSYYPFILDLYSDYSITEVFVGRSISCKADGRKKVSEVIVTNY